MKRDNAKKLNIRLTALLVAVVLACQIPSVTFAKEVSEAVTVIPSVPGQELSQTPAPDFSQTPEPVAAVSPSPAPAAENTPVPTAEAAETPIIDRTPAATETIGQVFAADIQLLTLSTDYVSVSTPQNTDFEYADSPVGAYNKRLEIQVIYNGNIIDREVRYYKFGHTYNTVIDILSQAFNAGKISYEYKGVTTEVPNSPMSVIIDDMNLNVNFPHILRIELGSNINFTNSSDYCVYKNQSIDLTRQVTVSSGFTDTLKYYNGADAEIINPSEYTASMEEKITARAIDGFGNLLAETSFKVFIIDPIITPSEQTILFGQSAVIAVTPDPLSCGLHDGSSFTFEWSVTDPDAGLPGAAGQSVTVTPLKTGTYTYEVKISHFNGTETLEKTLTAKVTVLEGEIRITHSGSSGAADPGQSFVFEIIYHGTDGSERTFYEVIRGNGTATVNGLGAGTYTVNLISGWSWRYSTSPSEISVTLDAEHPSGNADFTSSRTILSWLSGEAFAVNRSPAGR